jgi:MinD-like ATPase involved in chromosome partitioning or flagellar assembly
MGPVTQEPLPATEPTRTDDVHDLTDAPSTLAQINQTLSETLFRPSGSSMPGFIFFMRTLGLKRGWTNSMPPKQPWIKASDRERQSDELYAKLLSEALVRTTNEEGVQRIMAILNSKGGVGKTPLAAQLAVVLYAAIQAQVVLIDANENRGGTADALGVPAKATIRYALRYPERFRAFEDVCDQLIKANEYGVYLLASDAHGLRREIDLWAFVKLLLDLKSYGGHSMVGDCGNGNDAPTNIGMATVATNLIIPLMEDDPQSYKDALATMWEHILMGREDKVLNALIVVNATKPGCTKADIMRKLTEATSDLWVKGTREDPDAEAKHKIKLGDFDLTEDRIFLVPFSQYIKDRRPASADSKKIGIKTLIAYLEILVAIFSQYIKYTWREIDVNNQFEPGNSSPSFVDTFEYLEQTHVRGEVSVLRRRDRHNQPPRVEEPPPGIYGGPTGPTAPTHIES